MSGTNCYIFQQHYDILRELKQQNIRKFKIVLVVAVVVVIVVVLIIRVIVVIVVVIEVVVTVVVVFVAVTVETSSRLILSYEIRFVGLGQDITNNFRSI